MTWAQVPGGRWDARRLVGRVALWSLAFAVQGLSILVYLAVTDTGVTAIRYLVYPFVWVNASAWALLRVRPPPGTVGQRLAAGAVSTCYLAVMLYVAGFLGHGHTPTPGLRIASAPPGWGPMIAYHGPSLRLFLVPFQAIGYLTLAYLLYVALLDAARAAFAGVFGLVSCVGCTWTLVSPLVVGFFGASSVIGTTIYAWSYDLTTVVFLGTVGILVWAVDRPSGAS